MIVGGLLVFILILLLSILKMSIETIYISLFMIGVSGTLLYLIPYLLLIESVSPDYRSAISGILPLFDDLSLIYLPILYEFTQSWRIIYYLNLVLTAIALLPIIYFIRESPKFLVSDGKFKQAKEVYKFIANVNKQRMFPNQLEGESKSQHC